MRPVDRAHAEAGGSERTILPGPDRGAKQRFAPGRDGACLRRPAWGAVVNFMNYEGWEWGKIAAGGTMVMLPVLFFSILVRRFLVHGLTAGALKG
jgi:hypothetical protein